MNRISDDEDGAPPGREEEACYLDLLDGRRLFLGWQPTYAEFNRLNLAANNDGKIDRTGLRLWPRCTRRAADFLCKRPLAGLAVIELGCGAFGALATVCVTLLGARRAVATDGNADTIDRARKNQAVDSKVQFDYLRWGEPFNNEEDFDVVVGSELMYYGTPIDALVATLSELLLRRSSFALLCHVYRDAELPRQLADLCAAAGLACFDLDDEGGVRAHVVCDERNVAALAAALVPEILTAPTLAERITIRQGAESSPETTGIPADLLASFHLHDDDSEDDEITAIDDGDRRRR